MKQQKAHFFSVAFLGTTISIHCFSPPVKQNIYPDKLLQVRG